MFPFFVNLITPLVNILHSHIKHLVYWLFNFSVLESSHRTSPEAYVTSKATVQMNSSLTG